MKMLPHDNFELNGKSFDSIAELVQFSKSFSESIFTFFSDFFDDSEFVRLQTSGSTGTPKLIEIKKKFMINSAEATGAYFNLKENTTALLCMNPEYVAGKMMLVRAMVLGWKLDVVPASLNPLQGLGKTYDFSAMVPLQVSNSLMDLYKIKKIIIGGGAVSKELEKQLQNSLTECFSTYGMTETVSHIAVRTLNNHSSLQGGVTKQSHSKNENVTSGDPKASGEKSYYSILPNILISKDNRNCLVIDAPKVTESQIITNDIVTLISEKEFKWLGRYDAIINSGGVKLIPEQIEEKLSKIIAQRFFVAGISDDVLGEKLVLLVENDLKGQHKERTIILREAKNLNSLSAYEIPKEIYFLDSFVETETKKIQRKKTLDLLSL